MSGIDATTFGLVAAGARSVMEAAIPEASVYDYAPVQGFNSFPVIFFIPPNFTRKRAGEPETALGSVDLLLEFTLMAFVLDNATGEGGRNAEDEAAQLMGKIIGAFDVSPQFQVAAGITLDEAVVSSGEFQRSDVAVQNVQGGQPVVGYEAILEVQAFVG